MDKEVQEGENGLINHKPCPENLKLRTPIEVEEKVIYLRKKYHFGPERIYLYLKRYLNIETSESSVYLFLRRNGINRIPKNVKRRSPGPKVILYEKQVIKN